MTKMRAFHELATVFPLLSGNEAKALAEDIFAHGLREPITLLDGKILDGRNRYLACVHAGIEPRFTDYTGDNAAAFVISLNLKRRHLDESQRAMVAAKLANLPRGSNQHAPIGATSDAAAAALLNVGERSVERAKTVQREAVPEIVKAVEKGEASVSAAAQFAKQPKKEQAKQVREGVTPADAVKAHRKGLSTKSGKPKKAVDAGSVVTFRQEPPQSTDVALIGKVRSFAKFCDANPPASVAVDVLAGEVSEVCDSIAVIRDWLGRFQRQVEATPITTKAAEGPRGPDIVPPAKHEPVAAASDPWEHLGIPPWLARREKASAEAIKPIEVPAL
jgi:hypothetical protein